MTVLEILVCLVQQTEAKGVAIQSPPLKLSGPAKECRGFAEVVTFLREKATQRGTPLQIDRLLEKMKGRGDSWCALGGIDWQNLSSKEWAFTRHEQKLLAEALGSQVEVGTKPPVLGRLEGVMPGKCLITLVPFFEPKGDSVACFLQRTERAQTFCSRRVEIPLAS